MQKANCSWNLTYLELKKEGLQGARAGKFWKGKKVERKNKGKRKKTYEGQK